MPKSNKKSKSKSSTKQSQKQKQQIVVNVNSNNKRKSTHYHNKNSNNPPAHIVVPGTNHHMMFMPQPQGQPPPNLLGDNAYGIGQARLLDTTLQRMNETIDQVEQNALNSRIQQEAIHNAQERRQQQEDQHRIYTRDDYQTPSRGAGSSRNRSRTSSVHSEAELLQPTSSYDNTFYSQMQDLNENAKYLSSDQRNLLVGLTDHLSPENNEAFAVVSDSVVVHPSQINYNYQPPADTTFSMADLTQGSFGGSIEPKLLQFKSPRNMAQTELRNTMLDFFDRQGEMVPKSLVKSALEDLGKSALNNNTLEVHYKSPLAIENTPSKTVSKIEDIKYASDNNADEVHIKVVPQTKEEREHMRSEQRRIKKEQEEEEKHIAHLRRIAKEKEREEQAIKAQQENADIRKRKNEEYLQAKKVEEKISNSTKFENPTELILSMDALKTTLSAAEDLQIQASKDEIVAFNKIKTIIEQSQNPDLPASRVGKIRKQLMLDYLDKHEQTIKGLKKKQVTQATVVPTSRYKANNITNATTLLTSRSESSFLPPIEEERGGGGAIRILGNPKQKK